MTFSVMAPCKLFLSDNKFCRLMGDWKILAWELKYYPFISWNFLSHEVPEQLFPISFLTLYY